MLWIIESTDVTRILFDKFTVTSPVQLILFTGPAHIIDQINC